MVYNILMWGLRVDIAIEFLCMSLQIRFLYVSSVALYWMSTFFVATIRSAGEVYKHNETSPYLVCVSMYCTNAATSKLRMSGSSLEVEQGWSLITHILSFSSWYCHDLHKLPVASFERLLWWGCIGLCSITGSRGICNGMEPPESSSNVFMQIIDCLSSGALLPL